jgi:hypothetical protein
MDYPDNGPKTGREKRKEVSNVSRTVEMPNIIYQLLTKGVDR